jgi:lysophospholipase L1-like esterase
MQVEVLESRRLLSHAPDGVGVLGDSYSDEYRFYAPDRSTARNFVEQLADDAHLDFGRLTTVDRSAPRNAGFAYNWAQSADTSSDMLADGQLSGLAAQVAAGRVDLAFVFIGGNDFRGVFTSNDPVATLGAVVPQAVSNVFTAVNTLLAASPDVNVVVATLPKVSVLPEVRGAIALGYLPQALADAVDFAIGAFNEQVRGLAADSSRIALADVGALVQSIFAPATFQFGGVAIDRQTPGNDPRNLWLADGLHAGSIGQGLLANLFVDAANEEFDVHIHRLSDRDILKNAGLWRGHGGAARRDGRPTSPHAARCRLFSDLQIEEAAT